MKSGRKKQQRGAVACMKPGDNTFNMWLAMFGPAVSCRRGRRMVETILRCSHQHELAAELTKRNVGKKYLLAVAMLRSTRRRRQRWLAPRLAALLGDAIASLDERAVEDLAAVIKAIRQHKDSAPAAGGVRQNAHPFHAKALQHATAIAWLDGVSPGRMRIPDLEKFLKDIRAERLDQSYVRRELKRKLGFTVAQRRGRPRNSDS